MPQTFNSLFPNWETTPKGEWCPPAQNNVFGNYEFGLYHEPDENTEYAGTYTLQLFCKDEVILCAMVTPCTAENVFQKMLSDYNIS